MDITTEQILTVQDKEQIIREVIDRYLIPHFMNKGFNASGQWVRTLQARNSSIWGADYTQYLVQGRGPNLDQDPNSIRAWAVYYGKTVFADWVQRKGLDLNPIAVAYNIAKEGTTIHKQGGSDLLDVLQSPEVLDFINQRVTTFARSQVELQFRRLLQKAF